MPEINLSPLPKGTMKTRSPMDVTSGGPGTDVTAGNPLQASMSQVSAPEPKTLDEAYERWSKKPNKVHLGYVINQAKPVIDKAVSSYAPHPSPSIKSFAKVLTKNAIQTYDPSKGAKLQTHLFNQLRQLQREAYSYNTVHVPEKVRFDLSDVRKVHNQFVEENGREPNDDELADATGLSTKRIAKMRLYDRSLVNEDVLHEAEASETGGAPPILQEAASIWEDAVYDSLSESDKLIYDLKLGRNGRKPMALKDIAKKLRISSSAVSQRLKKISDMLAEGADVEF